MAKLFEDIKDRLVLIRDKKVSRGSMNARTFSALLNWYQLRDGIKRPSSLLVYGVAGEENKDTLVLQLKSRSIWKKEEQNKEA